MGSSELPVVEEISNDSIEKEQALKLIEEKLAKYQAKKDEENQGKDTVRKKSSHFWSDFKVYFALTVLVLLAVAAVIVKVYVFNPQLGITFTDTSNKTKMEQNKNSNQKYTGIGYLPDYDGYIA